MIFYTSDHHWGHANIIKYQNRPYSSVQEMDRDMITKWNSVVKPHDVVYHLGDFAFYHAPQILSLRRQLNGTIHIIWGNHDKRVKEALSVYPQLFETAEYYKEIHDSGEHITLCHYAMRVWNKSHRGSLMLYGHSHGQLNDNNQSLDVGVDAWNFRPVTLAEIKNRMKTLPAFYQEDFHGKPSWEIVHGKTGPEKV